MKNWRINGNRLSEQLTSDQVQERVNAAKVLVKPQSLWVLFWLWVGFLFLLSTLILTVRLALELPLYG